MQCTCENAGLPFETVKNLAEASNDRAAGELEGARPASNTIARRPKSLDFSRFFGNSILSSDKMLGGE